MEIKDEPRYETAPRNEERSEKRRRSSRDVPRSSRDASSRERRTSRTRRTSRDGDRDRSRRDSERRDPERRERSHRSDRDRHEQSDRDKQRDRHAVKQEPYEVKQEHRSLDRRDDSRRQSDRRDDRQSDRRDDKRKDQRDADTEREREALKRSFTQRDARQPGPNDRPNNIHSLDRSSFDRDRESRPRDDDSWKQARRPPPPQIRDNAPLPPLVLADIVPLHLRTSKLALWDKAPPGYDGMSVVQVKMTGHFPTPGLASRSLTQMTALPAHLLPGYTAPSGDAPSSSSIAQYYKQARRMYVEGIPPASTERSVLEFFNATMKGLYMAVESGNPATGAEVDAEGGFAYVEFRTPEEATAAISLAGITFPAHSQRLLTHRPKEYISPDGSAESPHKISITGIPTILPLPMLRELFEAFGELKFFTLNAPDLEEHEKGMSGGARVAQDDVSNGTAVCEYVDPSTTDIACQVINGMELAGDKLVVQRSNIAAHPKIQIMRPLPLGAHSTACIVHVIPPHRLVPDFQSEASSRVVCILNMLDPLDIQDIDDAFLKEVTDELEGYGAIGSLRIPKAPLTECGKVFVEYECVEGAEKALEGLSGRLFIQRTLACCYYDEEKYALLPVE